MKNGISLVINTKNEENHIKQCIQSAKTIVDEIIIVDMKSNDRTVSIAKKLRAKTYTFKDYGYVEPARNYALQKPRYSWTLLLDADERLTPKLGRLLKKIQQEDLYDVVFIPYKNMLLGKWIKHTAWWPDYHPRFFKTGFLTWSTEVHSEPQVRGRITHLSPTEKNAVIHMNVNTIDDFLKKMINYTNVSNSFSIQDIEAFSEIIHYYEREFNFRFIDNEGYKDGLHGFYLSKLMEYYRFLETARSWEKNQYKSPISDKNLKEEYMKGHANTAALDKLQHDLDTIQSAKFYKLWQQYNHIKNIILRRKK